MDIDNLKTRSDLSLEEIEYLMKKEKNVKVYKKLSYIRFRTMGYSKLESFELANIKRSTGYHIEDIWEEKGYMGLLHKKNKSGSGRKSKLNNKQLKELSKILSSEERLTIHDVMKIIKDKWDINYTYAGAKTLLINHFNVDINEYLAYNKKTDEQKIPDVKNFEKIIGGDKKEFNEIIKMLENENDVFVYRKLLSLIFQKLGYSLTIISKIIGVTPETLSKWNKQWDENGYKGFLKKSGQGRKPKLTEDNWAKIRKILETRNDWTLTEISHVIEIEFGVKYALPHLATLLKKN